MTILRFGGRHDWVVAQSGVAPVFRGMGAISGPAFELIFVGNALVRFARALDAVLLLDTLVRQDSHDGIPILCTRPADGIRSESHVLADPKFASLHGLS